MLYGNHSVGFSVFVFVKLLNKWLLLHMMSSLICVGSSAFKIEMKLALAMCWSLMIID